jgi:hypothetical protein
MRSYNLSLKASNSLRLQATPNIDRRIYTHTPQALISIRQVFIRSEKAKDANDANSQFLESARMVAE